MWKDEAFGLWESQWGALYPKGSPSSAVIDAVVSSHYLVTVVDNDYVAGDLFGLLVTATDVSTPPFCSRLPSETWARMSSDRYRLFMSCSSHALPLLLVVPAVP